MNLSIKNVSHTYDIEVINDLNIDLQNYHSIAMIGVSGSGKSTLLRLLAGLETPTEGTLTVNGRDVSLSDHRRSIGMVFQTHSLFPHLTLKENITLVLEKTRGIAQEKASAIADENLDRLSLADQGHKLPQNVSGGQAQRASIARALSIDPEIIFLDEPTASLDPILTDEVLSGIEKLKTSGKDFIFVSHVLSFVRDFADYVIYMDKGKIVEHGTPDILDAPKSSSLKNFMSKVR